MNKAYIWSQSYLLIFQQNYEFPGQEVISFNKKLLFDICHVRGAECEADNGC